MASDIVIIVFQSAIAGDAMKLTGVNGWMEFRVSPSDVSPSAYNNGDITATPFDATVNETIGATDLTATTLNGTLCVRGLTVGQPMSVYNLSGTLVYRAVATAPETKTILPACGIYIIRSDDRTLKRQESFFLQKIKQNEKKAVLLPLSRNFSQFS